VITILIIVAVIAYVITAQVTIGSAIMSATRGGKNPIYWVVAAASSAIVPFAIWQPIPLRGNSESATYTYMLQGAFSQFGLICIVGSLACLAFAFPRAVASRTASGATWGFLAAYVARLVALVLG
jgi:hypothetical protein